MRPAGGFLRNICCFVLRKNLSGYAWPILINGTDQVTLIRGQFPGRVLGVLTGFGEILMGIPIRVYF